MNNTKKEVRCNRCGTIMEFGYTCLTWTNAVATPLSGTSKIKLVFAIPGEQTSPNPVKAFKQGLSGIPAGKAFEMQGCRCPACGTVELIAQDQVEYLP